MNDKMDNKAIEIAKKHIVGRLDMSYAGAPFDIFIVWKAKVLQNWKYLISSTLVNGLYYELTYNGDKNEWYLDAYMKIENHVIREGTL